MSETMGQIIRRLRKERNLTQEELTKLLNEAKRTYKGAVLKGIEAIEVQLKGYSGAEIARMYGVKNNNVTSWISKARAALGKEYAGYCG